MFSLKELKDYREVDIQEMGYFYNTPISNIKEEYREEYGITQEDIEKEGCFSLYYDTDICEVLIDCNDIETEYFEDEPNYFMNNVMKNANNYLLVAYNHNWLRQTGVKFVNDIKNCFYRVFDCSQYVVGRSKGGKVLAIRENHHDNPTGSVVLIVALTDSEYEKLEDYEKVETLISFGDKMKNSVVFFD